MTSASTGPFGLGFQPVTTPDAVIAPRYGRDCPPSVVNLPPAWTTEPSTESASTPPFAPGFHVVRIPVAVVNAPRQFRVGPARAVKLPPTYRVPAFNANASTIPFAPGFQLVGVADVASIAADRKSTR